MPTTTCFAQVRGSVMRVTRLDSCGNPDTGQSAVAVSKRVSSIALSEVSDDGTNIRERNFAGELTVVDDAYTEVLGYGVAANFCGVDPGVINIMTRQPVAVDYSGNIIGFDAQTGINLDDSAFALEIWSKLAGSACDPSGNRKWGYTVLPFVKGGRLGDFTFENGLVGFNLVGAQTRDGNNWGTGPFDVMRNASNVPAVLATPLTTKTHYRNIVVNMTPPVASCGAFPIAAGSF